MFLSLFQANVSNVSTRNIISVGLSEGLSIPRSSVRFRLKPDNSNSHEFEVHRPSNKGTKLLLKVIKATIIIINYVHTKQELHDNTIESNYVSRSTLPYM